MWIAQGWSSPAWHLLVSILHSYRIGPISGRRVVDSVGAVAIVPYLYRLRHTWTKVRGGVKRASWNLTPLLSLTPDVPYLWGPAQPPAVEPGQLDCSPL